MSGVILHVYDLNTLLPVKHCIAKQFHLSTHVSIQDNSSEIGMIRKGVVPELFRGLLITKGYLIQLSSVMCLKNTLIFLCTQYTLGLKSDGFMST